MTFKDRRCLSRAEVVSRLSPTPLNSTLIRTQMSLGSNPEEGFGVTFLDHEIPVRFQLGFWGKSVYD